MAKKHISFVTLITTADLNKFNSAENLNFRTFVLYMEFEKSDPITIDSLLNRVRLGKYQYWIYLVLGVHYICDGAEAIAISLLGGILQKEWNISNSQISSLGSAVFLGIFVGSVLSGLLSDYFGRKKIFMYSLFMSIITCFLSAFAPTYNTMLFIRALFGVSVGFIQPCFAAYIAEITPQDQRGRALSVVSMLFTVGELIGWFCARVFLDSYTSGKWRVLLFWVAVPNLIAFVIAMVLLEESPRFAIFHNFDNGINVLNTMHKMNNQGRELALDEYEREDLKKWIETEKNKKFTKESKVKMIFNKENWSVTWKLGIMWFVLSFTYYGIIFILPMMYSAQTSDSSDENKDNLNDLLWGIFGELPSYAACYWLIENPAFGRKNSLTLSYWGCAIACIIVFFSNGVIMNILVFLSKFFMMSAFNVIYIYTSEMYHTSYRTTGFGITSSASRIGASIMPWISIAAFGITPKLPFVIYAVTCVVAAIVTMMMPYDTQGRELDKSHEQQEEEEKDKPLLEMSLMKSSH